MFRFISLQNKHEPLLIEPVSETTKNKTKQKQKKNKSQKRFAGVTEKYLKTEESFNTYDGKLSERS